MQPCGHVFLESENLTSTNSISCQFLDLSLTYCRWHFITCVDMYQRDRLNKCAQGLVDCHRHGW